MCRVKRRASLIQGGLKSHTFEVVEASFPLLPLPPPALPALVALLPFPLTPDSLLGWLLPWHCLVALLPLPLFPLPLPSFSRLLLFRLQSLLPSLPSPPELGALPSPERSMSSLSPCFCSCNRLCFCPRALARVGVVVQLQVPGRVLCSSTHMGCLLLEVEGLQQRRRLLVSLPNCQGFSHISSMHNVTAIAEALPMRPGKDQFQEAIRCSIRADISQAHSEGEAVGAETHPTPPVYSRPQISQLVVPQGLDHVVRGSQLEARHHHIPIFLGRVYCMPKASIGSEQAQCSQD